MNQELQHDTALRDVELPDACLGCGGPVTARFAAGSARGVCFHCRVFSTMAVERRASGMQLFQLPAGHA
ncbi:MAG TPA: hypothetical protein VFP65_09025 [Anaeromyxobacteraceae bacterium]|nr:hypothetical protein [Anaeromyxobacteraceae bacterium]